MENNKRPDPNKMTLDSYFKVKRLKELNERINKLQNYYFGSVYEGVNLIGLIAQNPWQETVIQELNKMQSKICDVGLYIHSKKNRIGKTHMQAAIFDWIKGFRPDSKQMVFSDLQLEKYILKNYFEDTWQEVVSKDIRKTDYFYFTDFGKIAASKEIAMTPLFTFFDEIAANGKKMIFASNYTPEELAKFGDKNWVSIASRIHESVVYLPGLK